MDTGNFTSVCFCQSIIQSIETLCCIIIIIFFFLCVTGPNYRTATTLSVLNSSLRTRRYPFPLVYY